MSRLTINSNIPSLNAQRNLGNASKSLETSFTRLSSGLRINKASDDAAGLSISESLKSDTRIFNQGIRNLNDGLSLLNIADGALNELTNIVTRLSELAEQSANGTLGNKQRLSLDQEAQSLSKEYNRIARSTEFNGRKIFNGDFGDLSLAAGGNASSLITDGLGGAIGDGSFSPGFSLAIGGGFGGASVTLVDLNNDGISDVFSTQYSEVNTFIGNGDGTFKARISIDSLGLNEGTAFFDFNHDSFLDMVIADPANTGLFIALGSVDGSFKTFNYFGSGSNPTYLTINDFNNDGAADIISASNWDGNIEITFGNNDGTFKPMEALLVNFPGAASSISSTDFNNDGNIDFVVSADSGGLYVFQGNGNGTFKRGVSYLTANQTYYVGIGDFNGDGINDLATADGTNDTVSVYIGNNNGSFLSRVSFSAQLSVSTNLNLNDFNGDGKLDISTVSSGDNTLSILLGNGNGSFKMATQQQFTNGYFIDSGDVNNDGVADIVGINSSGSSVSVFIGNSNQGVSALQSFSLKTQQDSRDSITYLRQTLNRLSNQRGEIGAFQSRVETGVSNLQQSSLAYSEANSRITDIDVAEESSRLTATQILQQSATSVLAQANQQPRLVLQLLRDL